MPKKDINGVLEYLNDALKSKDVKNAHTKTYRMIATYEDKYSPQVKYLNDNISDIMTYLAFALSSS